MLAAKLYGAKDARIEEIPEPPQPGKGEVLLRIKVVGVCGSDLHNYNSGLSADSRIEQPLILGHEFSGEVLATGEEAYDGEHQLLRVGQRVAVDPATPCYRCEMCEKGHPNLCMDLRFYGLTPFDGAMRERMVCDARNCFPIPDTISDASAALLETLGVAIHAVDLGKIRLMDDVAVLGCGPVGLLIVRLLRLSGVKRLFVFDKFPWRVEKACGWGATHGFTLDQGEPGELVMRHTDGRGVDVAFEAAWADESVQQTVETLRLGGRLVLVGIPEDNRLLMKHSDARRKGLTIMMSRRMKHVYPRAIQLVSEGKVSTDELVSHHYPLKQADKAIAMNMEYPYGTHKVMIDVG